MINSLNVRDYEVSIWTLQDSFITILKQSQLENKEKIQEPNMVLKDDGENTFSFKIPMYLQEDSNVESQPYFQNNVQWKENPIWYTTKNGNIIANMRKVKVIFNKSMAQEQIFEFIITKVTENHEGYSKYCEVNCEGLAFHELGKQGYNITLSQDDFLVEYQDWIDSNGSEASKPIANIDYWAHKVLNGTNWDYVVCMDWSMYDGKIRFTYNNAILTNEMYINMSAADRLAFNNSLDGRRKDKIYRAPYVSSWSIDNDNLVPATEVTNITELEKIAYPEGAESNRYNLLQTIAEEFQVFCKFIYEYDANYHIIGRKVVFYNNFISEAEGIIDFNYGYNTQKISREMDGNDLVSKMYIKSLSDSGVQGGEIYLSDSEANQSLENYLLNFDYLYKIGTISKEQYDEIQPFIKNIRVKNEEYQALVDEQNWLNLIKPEKEAQLKTAQDGQEEAEIRISEADQYLKKATDNTNGLQKITEKSPRLLVIIRGTNTAYSYVDIEGLDKSTLKIYKDIDRNYHQVTDTSNSNKLSSNDIMGFEEENHCITKIYYKVSAVTGLDQVYATFTYNPALPYETIKAVYKNKLKKDKTTITNLSDEAPTIAYNGETALTENNLTPNAVYRINKRLEKLKTKIKEKVIEKQELIQDFERLMGPALREGVWTPEDGYADYQNNKTYNVTDLLSKGSVTDDNLTEAIFFWDNRPFDEEQLNYYYSGIDLEKTYYPCINLTSFLSGISQSNLENLCFVYSDIHFNNTNYADSLIAKRYLMLNANNGCKYAFLRKKTSKEVIPVLMILGVEELLEETNATVIAQIQNRAHLSKVTGYNSNNDQLTEVTLVSNAALLNANAWITTNAADYEIVYPRFRIKNKKFIASTPEKRICRGSTVLEANTDYINPYFYRNKWYITFKLEKLLKYTGNTYTFHYALSTAADAMYLDALEIMKENSTPKVSYNITPLAIDTEFMHIAYNRIGQLAHINDAELKFENVQGYISEVNLNLDKPWEDTYTIKNYKTKFEDIFSSIVAQTESMKKNSTVIGMASKIFTNDGLISSEVLNQSLLTSNITEIVETVSERRTAALMEVEGSSNVNTNLINKIISGEVGLNFSENDTITKVLLNNVNGLLIAGKHGDMDAWFQVNNTAMGFFHMDNGREIADLQYINGNLTLAGHIEAAGGTIAGWEIRTNQLYSGSQANRVTLDSGTSGIDYAIWAGAENATDAPFKVKRDGTITATCGTIGGWTIGSNYIGSGSTRVASRVGMTVSSTSDTMFAFWAGADTTATGNSVIGAKFYVTQTGNLTASSADITGKITATSGIIGNNATNKITIGTNTTNASIYSGTKSTRDNTTNNGFYLGSDGLALGKGVFKVTDAGAVTASNITITGGSLTIGSTFSVTSAGKLTASDAIITGTIYATAGRIGGTYANNSWSGGWIITSGALYSGSSTPGNSSSTLVFSTGTASTKAIGGSDTTSKNWSLSIGTAFGVTTAGKLYATGVAVSGTITASSGRIGNWTISGNSLINTNTGDQSTETTRLSCFKTDGVYGLVLGATSSSDYGTAPFKVTHAGKLTASDATITGTIYATAGRIGGTYANNSWSGGWTIATDRMYSGSGATRIELNSQATATNAYGIWLGNNTASSAPFRVTKAGKLYAEGAQISGNLTATTLSTANRTSTTAANGTYIDSSGAIYGGQNKFTVTAAGKLTATDIVLGTSNNNTSTVTGLNISNDYFYLYDWRASTKLCFAVLSKKSTGIIDEQGYKLDPGFFIKNYEFMWVKGAKNKVYFDASSIVLTRNTDDVGVTRTLEIQENFAQLSCTALSSSDVITKYYVNLQNNHVSISCVVDDVVKGRILVSSSGIQLTGTIQYRANTDASWKTLS